MTCEINNKQHSCRIYAYEYKFFKAFLKNTLINFFKHIKFFFKSFINFIENFRISK
jgi:hypothetical protein